jgi:phage terminase Nu1 subunit (DNA packaging protein)
MDDVNTIAELPPRAVARKSEAAAWLGISARTLDSFIGEGLPVLRPSQGIVLVELAVALDWLRSRSTDTTAQGM